MAKVASYFWKQNLGPWCIFLDIKKLYEIQVEVGAFIFKTFTINSPYLSQYDHRIHKGWLNRSFGITRIHFTIQSSSLCSLHGEIGIQMNNTVYTSKEKKKYEFSSKKPSATKHNSLI